MPPSSRYFSDSLCLRCRLNGSRSFSVYECAAVCFFVSYHDQDVMAAAQTGSGKTLAFGLPVAHRLLRLREKSGLRVTCVNTLLRLLRGWLVSFVPFVPCCLVASVGWLTRYAAVSFTCRDPWPSDQRFLSALILTPTRELATQVTGKGGALRKRSRQ